MTQFLNQKEKGNIILPLVVLLCAAILIGWLILAYVGKAPASPEIATSTTPAAEPEKEQELSLSPPPKIETPSASQAKTKTSALTKDDGLKASIVLSSAKTNYIVGEEALVSVNLSTNANTAGADVFIQYDPVQLELVKANPVAGSGKNVAALYLAQNTGSIYGDFPQARLIDRDGKKVFAFSSLSKPQESFKGEGVIATLRFKTLSPGAATVKILSTPGQTNDTNVSYQGKDILKETKDITLIIK